MEKRAGLLASPLGYACSCNLLRVVQILKKSLVKLSFRKVVVKFSFEKVCGQAVARAFRSNLFLKVFWNSCCAV